MKSVFLIFIATTMLHVTSVAADVTSFFSQTDAFLKKYVDNGMVHYKQINSNFSEIESLYQSIADMDLSNANDQTKKAFYINAYNLSVIYQVAKYYPLKSPLDRSGFFDRVKHVIAGESMTLNALEIKKIVIAYKDARIHFALACAAISCPPLADFAYVPGKLDRQLDARTKNSINNAAWLKRDDKNKQVAISKIFDWYEKDFTMNGENSVLEFINKYKASPIPDAYNITYYEYNWGLNEG
ncbi:DUF547 domain-containing protein [Fulvivirga sp. M361]|uniref:DUF547 domain-containing protein n=1 Tax=Fulvivirga sp. M361 TaxID=2594266 RepID=UPI00117ABC57|nr:DUF547 domain-containing protein [Fulvivirga sp. M361]TRX55537.1 DUF547 domain-containing protein [Fulvivirga sp. M361]